MEEKKFYLEGVNGQISVYENRVEISRKGFRAVLTQGLAGSKTIPMDSIMSVQFKESNFWAPGFIQFGILGGREARGGFNTAVYDENSVVFKSDNNDLAKQIKEYIDSVIMNRHNSNGTVIQQTSSAEELKKFKELLDSGVISQEEFDTKKKQLLGL